MSLDSFFKGLEGEADMDPGEIGQLRSSAALLDARIIAGQIPVPPASIDGDEVKIFEWTPEERIFLANDLFLAVASAFSRGKKQVVIRIPGVAAFICANILNSEIGRKDKNFSLAHFWRKLLADYLPCALRNKLGIAIDARFKVAVSQNPENDGNPYSKFLPCYFEAVLEAQREVPQA